MLQGELFILLREYKISDNITYILYFRTGFCAVKNVVREEPEGVGRHCPSPHYVC